MPFVALDFFKVLMLCTDMLGLLASILLTNYWRGYGRGEPRIFEIYVWCLVHVGQFVVLSVSDFIVVFQFDVWWATLPIVRGLTGRLPITLTELWILLRIHRFVTHGTSY